MPSELDRIAAEGDALDLGAPGAAPDSPGLDAPAAPAGPSEADQIAMWAALPATFGSILSMAMPELAQVYTPAACNAWGAAMLPVAKKYGWQDFESLPELSLALVSLPFAIGTVIAVKRRRGEKPSAAPPGSLTEAKPAEPASAEPSVNAGVV